MSNHDEDIAPAHRVSQADDARPALFADWKAALGGTNEAVYDAVKAARGRVEKLADPFTPIAEDAPGARDDEQVVFEDDTHMVLLDRFGAGLKMLIVPKRPAMFLTDLSATEQLALERLAGRVVHALQTHATLTQPVQCWVNPPRALSVRQLHVHVQPHCNPPPIELARVLEAVGRELFGPQEVELKFAFNGKADADKARAVFGLDDTVQRVQVNTFYDTPSFFLLNREKMVCRVRREGDTLTLTLKGRSSGDGTLTQKREEEWVLDQEATAEFESGQFDPLVYAQMHPLDGAEAVLPDDMRKLLEGAALANIGSFENRRIKKPFTLRDELGDIEVTLEMDTTTFPGDHVAYELEIEVPDPTIGERVDNIVKDMLREVGVEVFPAASKAKRFFAHLRG